MRDTTIRDARKLGLYPSVTTILQMLSKFGLSDWLIKTTLEVVYNNQFLLNNTIDMFVTKTNGMAKKVMEIAPDEGTRMHKILEDVFNGDKDRAILFDNDRAMVEAVDAWIAKMQFKVLHTETKLVPDKCGYGGTIDLICEDNRGGLVFVDFKTVETKKKKVFKPYKDHLLQLCAYRKGFSPEHRARQFNLYISRDEMGKIIPYEHTIEEMAMYDEGWDLLLKMYKLFNRI